MTILITGRPEVWGIIPTFLNEDDPRPVREQFNANYQSGWQPFPGFTLKREPANEPLELLYPEDPPLRALSIMQFRTETIIIFEGEWVVVMQEDDSWEACRMD